MTHDIRLINRDLRAENARLRARLASLGIRDDGPPPWALGLTPTHAAAMSVLLDAHPRAVSRYALEEATRVRDHTVERDVRIVDVVVCQLRKHFGSQAIETIRGHGWRLATATATALRPS